MSIILDALKKADNAQVVAQEGNPASQSTASPEMPQTQAVTSNPTTVVSSAKPSGVFKKMAETKSAPKEMPKSRLIVLAVLVVCAAATFGYVKYYRKPLPLPTSTVPAVKQFPVAQPSSAGVNNPKDKTVDPDEELLLKKIADLKSSAEAKFLETRYKEASQDYQALLKLVPTDVEVYNNYGVVLKKLNRKKDAEEAYLSALDLKDDYVEAYNNLGVLYISNADYHKAKTQFEKAIKLDETYPEAYLHLGLCQEKIGQREAAIATYQKFLDMATGSFEVNILLQVENRVAKLKEN